MARAFLVVLAISAASMLSPLHAHAQERGDRVTLAEVVPALAGSELGALDLGPAPAAGTTRVLRRREVLDAIQHAGRSAEGLVIPSSVRIERRARTLEPEQIAERAREAVAESLAPCTVHELVVRSAATLPAGGEPSLRVEAPLRPTGGASVVTIVLESGGGRAARVAAQVRLECPAPVVTPGRAVRVLVRSGVVRASAEGVARQSGRVGDLVRVHVVSTGAVIQGRVVDASTIEVTP